MKKEIIEVPGLGQLHLDNIISAIEFMLIASSGAWRYDTIHFVCNEYVYALISIKLMRGDLVYPFIGFPTVDDSLSDSDLQLFCKGELIAKLV